MKEITTIVNAYEGLRFSATKAVLATVARVEGSSYRRTGARMLVLEDGTHLGGISGGCLEGDALRRAQNAMVTNKASVVTYDTTQDDNHQIGVGLGCNGIIDVLLTPLDPFDEHNPIRLLSHLTGSREPRALISIIASDGELNVLGATLIFENDAQFLGAFVLNTIAPALLTEIKEALAMKISRTVSYKAKGQLVKLFIEIILPVTRVMLYGGNYDIYSMLRVTRELGWESRVITNSLKAGKEMFRLSHGVINNDHSELPMIDQYTAVILMSHDYNRDFNNFQRILETRTAYIGMLGPRKRAQKMFDSMAASGNPVSTENLGRIFAPAGLDIGASTPEEIALSIAAEIRSHFAGRNGMSLRERKETIYGN